MKLRYLVMGFATTLAACATEGEPVLEDGRDDTFTSGGKLDGFECTAAEAAAILQVVNTASLSDLKNDVGLATKAADNVVAYRLGDDEIRNTADDETFGSLAELDAVPYIGPVAFTRLLTYVHDAELVGPPPAPTGQWNVSTIANGSQPDFALTPDGEPVMLFNSGGFKLRRADGTTVALPTDLSTWNATPQVAVDSTGTEHILYMGSGSNPASFKHASLRNGQWEQHDPIPGHEVWVDQSPTGTIFVLARTRGCSQCSHGLAIHHIAADGSTTSESLWTVSDRAEIAFTVGNDEFPAIAYGESRIEHARRGAAGWRTFRVNKETAWADSVATTGGDNATVFAAADGMRTYRQAGSTFGELQQIGFSEFTPHVDATADSLGTAHACFQRDGSLVLVQADTTGAVNETELGVADGRCWLGSDATGVVHLFFTKGNVINHATYE